MSKNPKKDDMLARKYIDSIMLKLSKGELDNITINSIVRQTTLLHPVSPMMVKRFIIDCYVQEGLVNELDGVLYGKKDTNRKE